MYFGQLQQLMQHRALRPARIAQAAGVSRAAVSKWLRQGRVSGWINVETNTLRQLAAGLQIPMDGLLKDPHDISQWHTTFLWDHLYPDMEAFVAALRQQHLPALARLTQTLGFGEARKILGQSTIALFPQYKRYLKPIRRRHLELLWPLYRSAR